MKQRMLQNFIPEKEISIDAEHSIEQLSGRFQNVKDGLPELIKNSKDHYSRLKIRQKEDRQIIVIVSEDSLNLAVLDFAGAALEDFKGWKTWSSRIANQKELAEDIEGGYGNGGKSFMVRGCLNKSSMLGCRDGNLNKWGFINNDPKLRFKAGTFRDSRGREIKNLKESSVGYILNRSLQDFGLQFSDLPKKAQDCFNKNDAFTFVSLENVKSWDKLNKINLHRATTHIPVYLMEHAQASLTIETCEVWFMVGKKLLMKKPLEVLDLLPFEGLEFNKPLPIPDKLIDPETGEEVKLKIKNKEKNFLIIKTSKQNLRLSDRLKPRNVIRVRNSRNIIANWMLADLVSLTSSPFIYGSLTCEELDDQEYFAGTGRLNLAENPTTRALKNWVSEEATKVAQQILEIQRNRNTEEDKEASSETINKLRDLMKEFLQDKVTEGEEGAEKDKGESEDKRKRKKKSKSEGPINEIILESPGRDINIALGTIIPLIVKCYKNIDGERKLVKGPPLISFVNNPIIEWVGHSFIKGKKEGSSEIYFETQDGKLRSNSIKINVKNINKIEVAKVDKILKQGETINLNIKSFEKDAIVGEMIYEAHVDEIEMGKINRRCIFTAGGLEGTATVRIKYGLKEDQTHLLKINIGNEKIKKQGDSGGTGIPLILICGTEAPGREDLPSESRTLIGGEDYPTIIDVDPLWEGIIWINPYSKESIKVGRARGEGGTVKMTSLTFRLYLTLKCFEILKRLKVEESFHEEARSMYEFKQELATAEMETAGFLERAHTLVRELVKGEENDK